MGATLRERSPGQWPGERLFAHPPRRAVAATCGQLYSALRWVQVTFATMLSISRVTSAEVSATF